MNDDKFNLSNISFFSIENAYNVQDLLSVYGLTMSTSDIMEAFNKKNDSAAVSIRELATSCKYFIVSHAL